MNRFDSRHRPSRSSTDAAVRAKDSQANGALSDAGASRRRFLAGSGALTTGLAAAPLLPAAFAPDAQAKTPGAASAAAAPASVTQVRLKVNGRVYELTLDPRVTLL